MKSRFLFVVLLLCFAHAAAQKSNVFVKGALQGPAATMSKKVSLLRYSDPLSRCEILADSMTVRHDGSFLLSAYANYPEMMVVQIDDYSQSLYVEPGRTYHVVVPDFDWDADERQNIHLAPVALPLLFDSLPSDELNIAINRFDHFCDSFVVANRLYFDQRFFPRHSYFDTLSHLVKRQDFGNKSDFFERYKTYHLAAMEHRLGVTSKSRLFNKYLSQSTPLYYDASYMYFFLTLFDGSISQGTQKISLQRLMNWVAEGDIATYLDSIGLDPMLRNEQVRELAALKALQESYYDQRHYDTAAVRHMVERFAEHSKFAEHRKLARSLAATFGTHQSDDFGWGHIVLRDDERRPVALDTLLSRWTYVAFVRVDDPNSVGALQAMASLMDTVRIISNDSVTFLTVVCDREFQRMYHFLHNTRHSGDYTWHFLHFDGDYRLLEHFDVVSYPTFVLVEQPVGVAPYWYEAPSPETGFLLNAPWRVASPGDGNEKGKWFRQEE